MFMSDNDLISEFTLSDVQAIIAHTSALEMTQLSNF